MNGFGLGIRTPSKCAGIVLAFLLWWTAPAHPQVTIIPYQDTGYKYMVVAHGAGSGFEEPGFNDSAWPVGNAAFGEINGFTSCPLNNTIATDWPINTDILVRKHFVVPSGATNLILSVAIDNDIQAFVNGHDISSGLQTHEGCATRGSFVFHVDPSFLTSGDNVLAVRGRDRGGADLLDLQLTATTSPVCSLSLGQESLNIDPDAGKFVFRGDFKLSSGCTIDLSTDEVMFTLGDYTATVPGGSLVHIGNDYQYQKTINGIFVCFDIYPTSTPGEYLLYVSRSGGTLSTTSNPVPISLNIGGISGGGQFTADFY